MRFMPLYIAATLSLTACFDSEDPKKVELVDNTTKNTDTGKQAVSDEDFAALQEKVKALESQLAAVQALKSDISSLKASVASHESELNAVSSSLGAVAADVANSPTQLWLYDGNKAKKHRVVSIIDRNGYQVAIAEVMPGVNARYRINVPLHEFTRVATTHGDNR
jgi:DNA repair ATPase RecN